MKPVTWRGMKELQADWNTMPAELLEEADAILRDGAQAAKAEIVYAYPKGPTGNLKRGVKIFAARGSWIGGVVLKQTAPHGHLYENGTKVRKTKSGAFRNRMFAKQGFPDGRPTFGPIAAQHQNLAEVLLKARLTAHGATRVTGAAEWRGSATSSLL